MDSRSALAAAAALLLPLTTAAQDLPPEGGDGEPPSVRRSAGDAGYCKWVKGVAGAESALLLAPEIFGSAGMVNVGEAEGDVPLGEPRGRLMLGLEYDFVELWKGFEVQARAEAQCRRYEARTVLEGAVRAGTEVGAAPAFAARARALSAALPRAEALVAELHEDVQLARATIDELDVIRLRLDELRKEARDAAVAMERVQALPHGSGGPLVESIQAFREADARLEAKEGTLRNLNAWSLSVRGGYDEILDIEQDEPWFAQVTLRFNLGGFWVPSANGRAAEGRREWIEQDVMGADRRVSELVDHLHAVRRAEQARLEEVSLLVGDLSGQLEEIRAIDTRRTRRYEGFLFFELARLEGEQAWLEAHLQEIDRILGSVDP